MSFQFDFSTLKPNLEGNHGVHSAEAVLQSLSFNLGSATAFTKDKSLPAPVQEDDLEDMEANDDSTILQG